MLPRLGFKGFTLIELLVAVSILAVVATIGIGSYSQAQKLSRDAKRKQDLRSIAAALEIYKNKYGRYPCNEYWVSNNSMPNRPTPIPDFLRTGLSNSICDNSKPPLDQTFINNMPQDPLNTGGIALYDPDGYVYAYRALECLGNGQWYFLVANLENKSDPDRVGAKNVKWCNAGPDGTGYMSPALAPYPSAFIVTPDSL